jgi:demethylmenaquinone methyltransferase/2-methoxy-6-polyprenyl-1,4-benzoquinol methylase
MVANLKEGDKALDIAGGTGDLSLAFSKKVGASGQVVHTDINEAMLRVGRDRLTDKGVILPTLVCDAEKLPFPDNYFDLVSVAFGLRNMTHKDAALKEMNRVLRPAASCWCWSSPRWPSRWRKSMTGTRSRFCRPWAR